MQNRRVEIHQGRVVSIELDKMTSKGRVIEFTYSSKERLIACAIWEDNIAQAMDLLRVSVESIIRGAKNLAGVFVVYSMRLPKPPKPPPRVGYAKSVVDYEEGRGFLLVKVDGHERFERKNECIFHQGIWKPHIEFIMDVLGPSRVQEEMRFRGISFCNTRGDTYKTLKSELLDEAKKKAEL